MSSSDNGDQEIYGGYSVDGENQPGNIDDLGDPDVADELDRGYSPPEKYSAGQGYGNTPWEEEHREGIDQRIAQEEPEPDPYAETDADLDGFGSDDGEVGSRRAGRLVDTGQGLDEDEEKDLVGDDIGIDDGSSSAEEAAMHIVEDYPED